MNVTESIVDVSKSKKSAKVLPPVNLLTLDLKTVTVFLEGTTPLITHPFSEKAKKKMRDKMGGKGTKGRENKDIGEDYEESFYRLPDGRPGMKILAFKNAAVTAVSSLGKEFTKVLARQAFYILFDELGGDLTPVWFPEDCPPVMREDCVTVGMGGTDLRYRPEFRKWGVKIQIQYNERAISLDRLLNLLNLGGFAVGVGEWRVERNGDNGRFRVVNNFSWEN